MRGKRKPVLNPDLEPEDLRTSAERIEDVCFENLIKRWTEAREFDWVEAAMRFYEHILEERERNAPKPGTPENPIVGVVVEDTPEDVVDAEVIEEAEPEVSLPEPEEESDGPD